MLLTSEPSPQPCQNYSFSLGGLETVGKRALGLTEAGSGALLSNLAFDSECELHSGRDQMCVVGHHFDSRGVLSGPAHPLFPMENMALVSST